MRSKDVDVVLLRMREPSLYGDTDVLDNFRDLTLTDANLAGQLCLTKYGELVDHLLKCSAKGYRATFNPTIPRRSLK